MNKGDLMKLVYSQKELRNVDSAIPKEMWDKVDTSIHVMDYNESSLGSIVNLYDKLPLKYEVGKEYRYSQIPENSNDYIEVNEYGEEYLGKNAIHIRINEIEIDLWFIWIGQANEGILKCVYNE